MEKREYQRTKVDIEGVFLLGKDKEVFREFSGAIDDISENGIKLVISGLFPEVPEDSINLGDVIHFTGIDNYVLYGKDRVSLVEGDAEVVRKAYEEDKIILGCKLKSPTTSLLDYVQDKKTSSFLVSLS